MRVGIFGNYGATNVGDDAILQSLLASHPGHEFTVFSANPKATAAPLFSLGFRSFFKHGFWRSLQALRAVDAVILGGGGLFQDDRLFACFLWAWQCLWVRVMGKPLFVVALGVGPLRTRLGCWLTRWALAHAQVITVRDQSSHDLLRAIGLNEGEIHVTADPAFLIPAPAHSPERTKGLILVSLRPWLTHSQTLLKVFTEFLLRLKNEKGARFVFVCMQSIREHDRSILEPLAKRLGGEVWVPPNFSALMARLGQAEFAIGMRYHFLIAALITETPALPISYSPKVEALFSGTSLERYVIPVQDLTADRLTENLKRLSVDYNNVQIYEKKRAEILREQADKNKALLDQFMADLAKPIDRNSPTC